MEENTSRYDQITAILMGKTGHGKSTLCNLLSDSEDFIVGDTSHSCTKEIQIKNFFNHANRASVSIIDTPGLSDSDGDDNKIIDDMKKYLIKPDIPRINAILIVISIQEPKMDKSIVNLLEEIIKIFPLKSFWKHVIIIWTKYFGSANQKKRLQEKAQKDFRTDFIDLTKNIKKKFNMDLDIIDNINMVFNEYDHEEEDEKIKAFNKTQTINNINQIFSFMKNMNPLYAEVKPVVKKDELIDTVKTGKFTIMSYEQVQYRIYIDFNFNGDSNNENENNREIKFRDVISEYKIKREDSETEFEPFQIIENNKRKSNKYKKYIFYDTNDNFIKEERTEDIIDWKTNEDKTERNEKILSPDKKLITITNYVLECTKNDPNGKKINIKISEQYTEEWRHEIKPKEELDENHLGKIYYKHYNCLYKNEVKISENEIPNKNYVETFEKDKELKFKIVEENGITYRINYYNVIKIDSREANKKNSTEYIIQESKNPLNILEKNEKIETKIIGNDVYHQNYKITYYKDRNGNENIISKEKVGVEEEEKIQTIEIYETEGLTKEEINIKKNKKEYPIEYNRIYYTEETNTERKKKTRMNKIEHIIIILEHKLEPIKRNNSYILEEYDKEIYIINGQRNNDERPKLNVKEIQLEEKEEKREMSRSGNTIQFQNYKIYFKIEQNNNKKVYKEEPFGGTYPEDIQYKYYEEFEGLSKEQIEEKKVKNSYPITYTKLYYKDELNTKDKEEKIMYKRENVEIKLNHITNFITKNNSVFYVEYDEEIYIINGQQLNNNNSIKINQKETPLQIEYKKNILNIIDEQITFQNNKIYYAFDERNEKKIYKEEVDQITNEKIQYEEFEEYEGISKEQIEEKKRNGLYPIIFRIIYFKKETNTKRDKKIIYKTENIEIKKEYKEEFDQENNCLKKYLYEKYFIDGKLNEDKSSYKFVNSIPLKVKHEDKIVDKKNDDIFIQNYKVYYKIGKDGEEEFCKEIHDGEPLKVEYGEEFWELEGTTQNEILEKRRENSYPIEYKKNYYQTEINTSKKDKKLTKSEYIRIDVQHFSDVIKKDNTEFLEEYDQEIVKVNGNIKTGENSPLLHHKLTPKLLKETKEETREEKISDKWHLFTENEHSFQKWKRYKYIYNFGEPKYSDWFKDGIVTYRYN